MFQTLRKKWQERKARKERERSSFVYTSGGHEDDGSTVEFVSDVVSNVIDTISSGSSGCDSSISDMSGGCDVGGDGGCGGCGGE